MSIPDAVLDKTIKSIKRIQKSGKRIHSVSIDAFNDTEQENISDLLEFVDGNDHLTEGSYKQDFYKFKSYVSIFDGHVLEVAIETRSHRDIRLKIIINT